eukprot:CAMPEP_0202969072 /NCGR_PEP_ID=MMETSP1396-20130829/14665_1 /ASSEMBLY_ACC=CAM_ASM_000872 /TAXON_ID= /ORGANISM="Pseudokeronopsis sp., Strain Brazil" /LENGTH=42 /DNA_ID= /DNA_START= /DNA_END= /DNA_ORIENTATION=
MSLAKIVVDEFSSLVESAKQKGVKTEEEEEDEGHMMESLIMD